MVGRTYDPRLKMALATHEGAIQYAVRDGKYNESDPVDYTALQHMLLRWALDEWVIMLVTAYRGQRR